MPPSRAAAIEVPLSVSPGRLWLISIHKIPKVKFQLTCAPGRLSNTSFCHLNSLPARRSAQCRLLGYLGW